MDDGGEARGRESEGAILFPAHFTTLDTAKMQLGVIRVASDFSKQSLCEVWLLILLYCGCKILIQESVSS